MVWGQVVRLESGGEQEREWRLTNPTAHESQTPKQLSNLAQAFSNFNCHI